MNMVHVANRGNQIDIIALFWRWLGHPWLLIGAGGLTFLFLLSALFLPQVPSQYVNDPVGTSRWLLNIRADYGATGELLAGLGFFNVLRSTLLRVLLILIVLPLSITLANLVSRLLLYRRLPGLLDVVTNPSGEPLALPPEIPLHRLRVAHDGPVNDTVIVLTNSLKETFEQLVQSVASAARDGALGPTSVETRLLALRNSLAFYLRPLLMVGLLLVLLVLWLVATFGWEVSLTAMPPGQSFRYAPGVLNLVYVLPTTETAENATLRVTIGDAEETLSVSGPATLRRGMIDLHSTPSAPGFVIQTADGSAALALLSQSTLSSSVGLTFPAPNNEQLVLLPDDGLGIRVVRSGLPGDAGAPTYFVEVTDTRGQSVQRTNIPGDAASTLTIQDGNRTLRFVPLPGLDIRARYLPGAWLLLPAIPLLLAGVFGYWQRPTFLLVQIGAWPEERSVVIAQSYDAQVLHELRVTLEGDPS